MCEECLKAREERAETMYRRNHAIQRERTFWETYEEVLAVDNGLTPRVRALLSAYKISAQLLMDAQDAMTLAEENESSCVQSCLENAED